MKELTGKPKRKETFWALLWSTLMLLVAALLPSGAARAAQGPLHASMYPHRAPR